MSFSAIAKFYRNTRLENGWISSKRGRLQRNTSFTENICL